VDRTARFDPSGAQVNANFGTANGICSVRGGRRIRRSNEGATKEC